MSAGSSPLSFLSRTSGRFALRHPAQFGLGWLGISLGIAVVIAIDIAVASSQRAFDLSVETVVGRATHRIVTDQFGVPESLYRELRLEHGFRRLAPAIEIEVARVAPQPGVVTILGIDPYAEAEFREWAPERGSTGSGSSEPGRGGWIRPLLTEPNTCVVSRSHLEAAGAEVGDALRFRLAGRFVDLRIVGTLAAENELESRRLRSVVLTDLATAQEAFGRLGVLSRIDVRLEDEAEVERLASTLPDEFELQESGRRRQSLEQMTRAFDLNLRSLSLLALLVGWFLIDNTMTFSVVQRRRVFGRLRTLGVTRSQIFSLVVFEGVVFGALGVIGGGLLGVGLGQLLVGVVASTIGDLYFAVEVATVAIPPGTLLKGALLGLGASVFAAWRPALEASAAAPGDVVRRSTLEGQHRAQRGRRVGVAVASWGAAVALIVWPSKELLVGYVSLLLVVIGFVSLCPLAIEGLVGGLLRVAGSRVSVVRRYAIRSIERHLSRTAFAIATLSIAVAMAIGVGVMVSSFRGSVVDWLDQTISGDVYVGLDGTVSRRGNREPLDARLCQRAFGIDGLIGVVANRRFEASTSLGSIEINAREVRGEPRDTLPMLEERAPAKLPPILASEPLAFRHDLELGSTLSVATPSGPVEFEVVGIFRDYVSDLGYFSLDRATYERFWDDRSYTALALYLEDREETDRALEQVRTFARNAYGDALSDVGFLCAPSRDLRSASLRIFDRTFRITDVLRILATLVAMVGVAGSFMALLFERTREFGILRSAGVTPRGMFELTTTQAAAMGTISGLLAIPLGLTFAAILTLVVNRRSFGWSMDFVVDPGVLATGVVTCIVAALIAGAIPAWRLSKVQPAEAMRGELG